MPTFSSYCAISLASNKENTSVWRTGAISFQEVEVFWDVNSSTLKMEGAGSFNVYVNRGEKYWCPVCMVCSLPDYMVSAQKITQSSYSVLCEYLASRHSWVASKFCWNYDLKVCSPQRRAVTLSIHQFGMVKTVIKLHFINGHVSKFLRLWVIFHLSRNCST
jgi:hypothetical protein